MAPILKGTVRGTNFSVEPGRYLPYWEEYFAGRWEPLTIAILAAIIDPQMVFVDLGAHIGQTTLYAAALGATVHAFEPDPVSFSALQQSVSVNAFPKVHLYDCAAGTFDGDIDFYSRGFGGPESSVLSLHERNGVVLECPQKIKVPQIDLVRFLRTLSPHRNQIFLKIDIEGGEYEICPVVAPFLSQYPTAVYL